MSDFFSFSVNLKRKKTLIEMRMLTDILYTSELPGTFSILEQSIPSIFRATCYNYANLPFCEEVKRTEIGHLFEHLILENLCKIRIVQDNPDTEFSGVTNWNWRKHPRGTFHITIDSGKQIKDIINPALKLSCDILNNILVTKNIPLPVINNSLSVTNSSLQLLQF